MAPKRSKQPSGGAQPAETWPLYPTSHRGPLRDDDCPRCGQNWINNRMQKLGYCILCAIDRGEVTAPDDLRIKGWRLHRTGVYCITASRDDARLSLPLHTTWDIDRVVEMARGYQFAWEWLYEGGRGHAWGWQLLHSFHIKYAARHPILGRVPRPWHDYVWLNELPALIIETLVVEQLQMAYYRRRIAAVTAAFVDRAVLADRAQRSAVAFAAIPTERFEQKELL